MLGIFYRTEPTFSHITGNRALSSVGLLALLFFGGNGAFAQQPAQEGQQAAMAGPVEEITVTGSRIVRDGFAAPTPVSVLTTDQVQDAARQDLADVVNLMPSLSNSRTPTNSIFNVSSGLGGVNALNLRGLGHERTLVLLDGQRSVGANQEGIVDISTFPQQLVSRVEVVTGGASAAYGSDAVSGVVNFILDKEFEGIKGDVSSGATTYGDNRNWKVAVSGGRSFARGRGHFLISGEATDKDGILDGKDRSWMSRGYLSMPNPDYTGTNGQPEYLYGEQTGFANAIPGGVITTTALRGTAFGASGTPYQFEFGDISGGNGRFMQGGDWKQPLREIKSGTIDPLSDRQSLFTRLSYEVTDNVEVFGQASWNSSEAAYNTTPYFFYGNITIRDDNPFIPESVLAQMNALGVNSFQMGLIPTDLNSTGSDVFNMIGGNNRRITTRYVVGAEGTAEAFNTTWQWHTHVQKGITRATENIFNDPIPGNINLAMDAVRDANGAIVCRSTLTDPSNGCVPFNPMGLGVNSLEAVEYAVGVSRRNQNITQDNFAISATGEPFNMWAGPVSLATGIEWRKEEVTGAPPDPISAENRFLTGNFHPTFGQYTVTEGFLETVVPLVTDREWARLLELNAAVRLTDYSTSGVVTTWKVGASYQPTDGVRFRTTFSHDIRAPNINDLYFGGSSSAGSGNLIDRFNNDAVAPAVILSRGNPDLVPEEADTFGVGLVVQPSFMPGFSLSADLWDIQLKDALDTIGAQNVVNICFDTGTPRFCDAITRTDDGRLEVLNAPFNIATQIRRGVDLETSYIMPLEHLTGSMSGDITFRVLATRYLKAYSDNTLSRPTDSVGSLLGGGPPDWLFNGSVTYDNNPLRLTLTAHGFTSGVKSNDYLQCLTTCPPSTSDLRTVNDNHAPGAVYPHLTANYEIGDRVEAFLSIQNLLNKEPSPIGTITNPTPGVAAINSTFWDPFGQTFRVGVRFSM